MCSMWIFVRLEFIVLLGKLLGDYFLCSERVFIKILSMFGSSGISQNIDGNLGTILGYSGPKVLEM
jgi:hypothetical protein